MKIYTKSGDTGETALLGGRRISKSHLRIQAYGDVDELNAVLGFCVAAADGEDSKSEESITTCLRREMSHLFIVGSYLATQSDAPESVRKLLPAWPEKAVQQLELEIDELWEKLEPLKNFILPGGSELSGRLHLARTVARRTERSAVQLADVETLPHDFLVYLNRLSDWLFALAREANRKAEIPDVVWIP